MTRSDNKPYHHGDLRTALLEAASSIICESGIDGLSMRRLADQVGVSRTAPYHHFKDKNALLCAIAEKGFEHQDAMVQELMDKLGPDQNRQRFKRWVRAYIRFAHENPETYDLMYGREIWKRGEPTESLQQVSRASFRLWVDLVDHMQQQGVLSCQHPALKTAQASWASLHGLTRLLIDGVYLDRTDLEEIAETLVDLITQ
ncbi:TetR/AcrR family transcriptional regulator [Marinobacterium sediminicola]|uniref:Transcriptional regulator, TetR family n=1 Tax=Marinobacterium sediminicola TaxID=518898 RepID=A0ABY1RXH8_9GAMM|nr:TetR/AcrR family transcriptional regulator [Marinobacterium sediminicola]ULG67784.1 TetR/AcrR family transcriptional regulator [Marinobacterium sediminicola]SMR71542.1 transcriptional regulator, TetR family [Marinobacterium sediminicola]